MAKNTFFFSLGKGFNLIAPTPSYLKASKTPILRPKRKYISNCVKKSFFSGKNVKKCHFFAWEGFKLKFNHTIVFSGIKNPYFDTNIIFFEKLFFSSKMVKKGIFLHFGRVLLKMNPTIVFSDIENPYFDAHFKIKIIFFFQK